MRFQTLAVLTALVSTPWAAAQRLVGIKAGVNPETGERPSRLNINDLVQAGPAWDLFVQALTAIEVNAEDDWLSWFQIAGIHGLPFKPYNGVDQVPGGATDLGYCPHAQITFITWHRPYMSLLEQTLQGHAERIAAQYTGSSAAAYKAAAETLRFPFWDWAVSSVLPPITIEPTVQITSPTGPLTLRNPLYSYEFQNFPFTDPDFQGHELSQFNETKRCVDNKEDSDGVNHFDICNEILGAQGQRLREQVYATFTRSSRFADMASTQSTGPSFESPHNTVHDYIAGGPIPSKTGHMGPVTWSGFDPIFWLHHSNVDRYFAMWQAIYHTTPMFNGSFNGQAIFATPAGPVTPETPLKPFLDGTGTTFWTSTRSTSTRELGYTYPGLNDWAVSPEELASQVRAEVNRLYGPPAAAAAAQASPDQKEKDYAVQIKVDRADPNLPLPASIEVHVGNVVAGEYTLLSMPTSGVGFSSIPLRQTLQDAGIQFLGREAGDVVAAIKDVMKVVVVAKNGEGGGSIPGASVGSLAVEIEDWDFTPARSEDEFPVYGRRTSWPVDLSALKP